MTRVIFLENTREFPEIIASTGAGISWNFCPSVLVLVIFLGSKRRSRRGIGVWSRMQCTTAIAWHACWSCASVWIDPLCGASATNDKVWEVRVKGHPCVHSENVPAWPKTSYGKVTIQHTPPWLHLKNTCVESFAKYMSTFNQHQGTVTQIWTFDWALEPADWRTTSSGWK